MSATGSQICGMPAHPMAYQPQPQVQPYQMDPQNPTTSHPHWQYGQQPGPYQHPQHPQHQQHQQPPPPSTQAQQAPQPQQQHHHPQERHPPARAMGPESQTAHWMNQHYMNGNWAYAQSPVPSIAPSVLSQSQYDDRMSMLSVNTAMTGHVQGDVERCFSSNGSTCENINPDMAFAQLSREVDFVLRTWGTVRDPIKRCEMAIKILMWLKSKGLLHLDENASLRCAHQIIALVIDGLIMWTPPNVPPPQEYIALACRLLEVFHKIVQHRPAIPLLVQAFVSGEGDKSLKELLCPFIPPNPDQRLDRCSYIVIEFLATILDIRNADEMKIQFLKAMKFPKMVHMLLKNLYDAPVCNVNVLIIMRNIISRDANIKNYLIRFQRPTSEPLQDTSLIRVIIERVLPPCRYVPQRTAPLVSPKRAASIISQACHLLRTLLHDPDSIDQFVRLTFRATNPFCALLTNDIRVARDIFNVFLHVSDSLAFEEVEVPLHLILQVMNHFQNEEIFKLGTGFLSNIVANKPKYKKDSIQQNAIQLLESIISKFPRIETLTEDKKRLDYIEIMSNSLRTLINLLPFWVQNAHSIINDEAQQAQILATVNKLLDSNAIQRYMNFLSFDAGAVEMNSTIELRSCTLRFLIILIKMPFISKVGFLDVVDENRKENIITHILIAYSWSCVIYKQPAGKVEKDQREKLIGRCLSLLLVIIEHADAARHIENKCRYGMPSPLDLIKESQNESFILLILEFCEKVSSNWEDITTIWAVDRSMMEGLANNRNGSIAKTSNILLSRMSISSSEPLADVFANQEFINY